MSAMDWVVISGVAFVLVLIGIAPTRPKGWARCECGKTWVAPGTRTEIAGVSHGETPCFICDRTGAPL